MFQRLGVVLSIVIIVNLIVVDYFLYQLWHRPLPQVSDNKIVYNCPANCPQITPLPLPTSLPTIIVTNKTVSPKTRTVQYLPIPGSGTTMDNKWVDLSGTEFYISTAAFPTLTESYFEANFKLQNGNGLAFLRLFDVTAGIEVWGSEVSTSSQSSTVVSSGKLTIRPGTHLYRVQAKSLTADTTIFTYGRIKLILVGN